MSARTVHALWLVALAGAVFGPVAVCWWAGPGEPASLWDHLAVMTGGQATALLVYTVAFASRLRTVTRVFGIDDMIAVHRVLGTVALLFVLAHLLVVVIDDPMNVWLVVKGVDVPPRAAAGIGALLALGTLVWLATLRQRIGYEVWRHWHLALAAGVIVFAALHVIWLKRLTLEPVWLALFVILAAATLATLGTRWLYRPLRAARGWMVADVQPVSPTASTVLLKPLRGYRWAFSPGQFAWLRLGRSPLAEDHPFSMSSPPGKTVEFCVSHRGDWTTGPLRAIRPGRRVWLDGPHGSVTLDKASGDTLVMIAAGVGIAPMMSMIRAMAANGDDREVRLIVPPVHLFADELGRLAQRMRLTVDATLPRPVTADTLTERLPRDADVFVCGPPALVDDVTAALTDLGIPDDRVHAERFGLAAELERAAP